MKHAFVTLGLAVIAGCAAEPQGPKLDPTQLPRAIARVETAVREMLAAVEDGRPGDAARPLQTVGKTISSIKMLSGVAGLTAEQQSALSTAVEALLAGFDKLRELVKAPELPDDFEAGPLRAEFESALAALKGALPKDLAAEVQARVDKSEASRAKLQAEADAAAAEAEAAAEAAEEAEAGAADADAGVGSDEAPAVGAPALPSTPAPPTAPSPPPETGAAAGGAVFRLTSDPNRRPAPICPSVMLYDALTLRHAPPHVDRVAEIVGPEARPDARWVQLVPTVHCRLNDDLTPAEYGLQARRTASWTAPENFEPMSDGLADRCRVAIAAAIERAVARDLNVAILPHLDPAGGPITEWRNRYDFRPDAAVNGHSYWSLLLEPIAEAIARHADPATRVDFCLSGEMGEALFRYPEEHLAVLERLRDRFAAGDHTGDVRLGVGLNWSGLAGRVDPAAIDRAAVGRFFDACDFVGYSCYTPVGEAPTAEDFARATEAFLAELRDLGVDLPATTPLLFTEVGLGGGDPLRRGAAEAIAPTPAEVAAEPWAGGGSGGFRPWRHDPLRALRRAYYDALCDYLASPEAARVERVFLWSEGPWDPQGVMDTFHRDAAITDRIACHNGR